MYWHMHYVFYVHVCFPAFPPSFLLPQMSSPQGGPCTEVPKADTRPCWGPHPSVPRWQI